MEGTIVRGVSLPSQWRSGLGVAVLAAKPTVRLGALPRRRGTGVRCSDGQDAENYQQAYVVEAEKMVPSRGHLFMRLTDGRDVEVNHVNSSRGQLLDNASSPTIFLKMADDPNLLLPIVVGEAAVELLMKGLHDGGRMTRPNQYQILKDIVGALNYEARMVRVTERVLDTYYARIYIGKPGDEELLSVDARPSDAINLAVQCKIPIYVNKSIVAADGVRPVFKGAKYQREVAPSKFSTSDSFLDSADVEPDMIAEEITLMKNMLVAVVEERYADAAHWRDELTKLRAISEWHLRQI